MAATNEKVLAMVGRELEKKKDISNQELFEKATKMDSSIGRLTPRQFHARYPLQWKRAKAAGTPAPAKPATRAAQPKRAASKPAAQTGKRGPGRPRKRAAAATTAATTGATTKRAATRATRSTRRPTPAAASVEPAGIRRIMLQFASDVAGAESRRDLVKVLADVDKYVDRVAKAAVAK